MVSFKRLKNDELQDANAVEDRITSLPDSIIQHILSFIPTRDAVATSVLSRRWEYLWVSVHNIDLDDFLVHPTESDVPWAGSICFKKFVERVLLLHDCSKLNKFRLSCHTRFDPSSVNSWICAAIKRNVQELEICLVMEIPFALPSCTFNNRILTALTIELGSTLQLPCCISLPELKTLQLDSVTFLDDGSADRLLSGCPRLEKLAFYECDWSDLGLIVISMPTLKSLIVDDLPFYGSGYKLNLCQVVIIAEKVSYLNYGGSMLNDIVPCNLSSLADAYIYMPFLYETTKENASGGFQLLTGLKSVKSLRISDGVVQCLFFADTGVGKLPLFPNLTHLGFSDVIGKRSIQKLVDLLSYMPNLESLVFAQGLDRDLCFGEDDSLLNPVPKCVSACLKSVILHNFVTSCTEIHLLKSLLETAPMLERLNVYCRKYIPGDPKKVDEICSQLMMHPRLSSSCVISFVRNLF